jgi:hypothetical protein
MPENRQVSRWNSFKERDYVRAGIPLKNEFAEPQATSFVDPKWWEDLPKIDPNLRDKLDSDPTLNEITRVLFKRARMAKHQVTMG